MSYTHNSRLLFGEDVIANSDRDIVINWCKAMLGDDPSNAANTGIQVELATVHYDSAIDDALQEYSAIINEWSALDNLANTFDSGGATTEPNPADVINISQRRVLSTFGFLLKKTNKYSELVGAGGNVTEQRAYFNSVANQQNYDLLSREYDNEEYSNTTYNDNDVTQVDFTLAGTTNITQADASNWEVVLTMRRSITATDYKEVNIDDYFSHLNISGSTLEVHLTDTIADISNTAVHYSPAPNGGWPVDPEPIEVTLKSPYSILIYNESGTRLTGRTLDRKKMEINEINWYPPSTIFKFYDPYNMGANIGAEAFGFSYTAETPFHSMPIFYDILRGAQHEMSAKVRRNNYSVIENNKRITLYPYPGGEVSQVAAGKVWMDYQIPLNPYESDELGAEGTIANLANIPYFQLEYTYINSIGKRWIHKWALSSAKEVLGRIRGKYTSVPVPNSEISLDGPSLLDEARQEKDELRESLRNILEKAMESALMENEALEAEALQRVLQYTPSPDTLTMG